MPKPNLGDKYFNSIPSEHEKFFLCMTAKEKMKNGHKQARWSTEEAGLLYTLIHTQSLKAKWESRKLSHSLLVKEGTSTKSYQLKFF